MGLGDLLTRLAKALDSLKIPYMIIGGQAVMLYGEPRQTLDVDVTVRLEPGNRSEIDSLIKVSGLEPPGAKQLDILSKNLVLPLMDRNSGIPVEFIFSPYGFEDEIIGRAQSQDIGGVPVRFISANDLVVYKILAGRPRDLEDVRGIIGRSLGRLDFAGIENSLREIESAMGCSDLLPLWQQAKKDSSDKN